MRLKTLNIGFWLLPLLLFWLFLAARPLGAKTASEQNSGMEGVSSGFALSTLAPPLYFNGLGSQSASGAPVAAKGGVGEAKSTIQQNRAAGDAFEQQVKGQLQQTQTGVVEQVTVKTQSGVKTRIDLIGRDVSGNIVCTECKASATVPLTRNQKTAHPEIQQSGATVVGKGKPGFPRGTKIPPITVNIIRP